MLITVGAVVVALITAPIGAPVRAQPATPAAAPATPPASPVAPPSELHVSATALLSGGNLARVVVQSRLTGSAGTARVQGATENSYRYGRNGRRVVEDDALSRNYLRLFPTRRGYGYLLGVMETNHRRSIDTRWQVGIGTAWNVVHASPARTLRAGLGIVHEQTRFRDARYNRPAYDGQAVIDAPRAILRLGGRQTVLARRLVLSGDAWYMAGLARRDADRAHALLSVQLPIGGGVSFRGEVDTTYEELTIRGANPLGNPSTRGDWMLSFGLAIERHH